MATIRQRVLQLADELEHDGLFHSAAKARVAGLQLAQQTQRAWKQRKILHKCFALVGAMDVEKWQLVQLNNLLRGAIIEQEVMIETLRLELAKHTSVIS